MYSLPNLKLSFCFTNIATEFSYGNQLSKAAGRISRFGLEQAV
jgi:hypothetical protein